MGTIIGLLSLAVAAVVVVALIVVAVRAVGPFVDGTTLFRAGPGNAPPVGTQEEDPPRWDFTAMRTSEPSERRPGGRTSGDPTGTHAH
jgi:hypothetical protein